MRQVEIEQFNSLTDACMWLEKALYDYELVENDLKGEIVLVNAQWRVSVITGTAQGELFDSKTK